MSARATRTARCDRQPSRLDTRAAGHVVSPGYERVGTKVRNRTVVRATLAASVGSSGGGMEEGDILRQRRNLVAMSCLLIIFDLAKVEVAKVGVLGTDLIIGDVRVLAISMWVVWAYFLLRYYQFWRADQPHLARSISEAIERTARASFKGDRTLGSLGDPNVMLHRHGWISGWKFQYAEALFSGSTMEDLREHEVRIPPWRVLEWRARALLSVAIHTPHFTEHALPFVLAAATPVVAVLTKICAQP